MLNHAHWVDTGGTSCVEQHFLAIARSWGMAAPPLFYGNYVPLPQVLDAYVKRHLNYLSFRREKRAHFVAQELGMISTTRWNLASEGLVSFLRAKPDGEVILVSVDPSQLPYESPAIGWADAHFIAVGAVDVPGFEVMDNYPIRHSVFTEDQLLGAYSGMVQIFHCLRKEPHPETYGGIVQASLGEWFDKAQTQDDTAWQDCLGYVEPVLNSIEALGPLSQALTYFRLTRQRLLAWTHWVQEHMGYDTLLPVMANLEEQLGALQHGCNVCEAYRIRKRTNPGAVKELLERVWRFELLHKELLPRVLTYQITP